jgi:CMP/dCMP kinase
MPVPDIIAIDGPAASGKSTLALRLAQDLGYLYFDTGVMYRAIALASLQKGIPIENEAALTALAEQVSIDVLPPSVNDSRLCDVLLNGQDVTWDIRKPEVDTRVSPISAYRGVRRAMTLHQRRIGLRGKIVMAGRDIGTVVFPEAKLKIYLDASPEERARRRYVEMISRGQAANYEDVLSSIQNRDRIDSTRAVAPLCPAPDAVIIDSDRMTIDQVLEFVMTLIHQLIKTDEQ